MLEPLHTQESKRFTAFPAHASALMTVDLTAVRHNYQQIQAFVGPKARVAGVIKANAYGFGVHEVCRTLYKAGCRDFFVANVDEALEIRPLLDEDVRIFIMNGAQTGAYDLLEQHNFIPTLLSLEQTIAWNNHADRVRKRLKAAIHVDTGLSREGMTDEELQSLKEHSPNLEIVLCMSHLASADELSNPQNDLQHQRFQELAAYVPHAERSFANSHGIARGAPYHFELVRPGMALFGYCSSLNEKLQLKPALTLTARIVRHRALKAGQSVGYNALFKAPHDMLVGLINVGYADGVMRSLTNRGYVMIGGHKASIIGKVSMDFTTIDITHIPKHLTAPGSWVEIVHDAEPFEALCDAAGTCTYEITTRLSKRFHRVYICESDG